MFHSNEESERSEPPITSSSRRHHHTTGSPRHCHRHKPAQGLVKEDISDIDEPLTDGIFAQTTTAQGVPDPNLRDVQLHTPIETQAEAAVLQALDEKNVMSSRGIFSQVPDEAFPPEEEADDVKQANTSIKKRFKAAVYSVMAARRLEKQEVDLRGRLAELTKTMQSLERIESLERIDELPEKAELRETAPGSAPDIRGHTVGRPIGDRMNARLGHEGTAAADDSSDTDLELGVVDSQVTDTKAERSPLVKFGQMAKHLKPMGWSLVKHFLEPKMCSICLFLLAMIFAVGILVAVAFFVFDKNNNRTFSIGHEINEVAVSWFILLLSRYVLTFAAAKATEFWFIDFLSLHCQLTARLLGSFVTLIVVQSKGFPFLLSGWSIYSFALLYGDDRFANHWLYMYYPDGRCSRPYLFNPECNKSGDLLESKAYTVILVIALVVGVLVTIKRFFLAIHFGRQTYAHYGDQLARLLDKVVLVSEVARISRATKSYVLDSAVHIGHIAGLTKGERSRHMSLGISERESDIPLSDSQQNVMTQLLEGWEEPELTRDQATDKASINEILEFRKTLALMDSDCPFSLAFGPAENRPRCIRSSKKVYGRLLSLQGNEAILDFSPIIARLAMDESGKLDQAKVKQLIRLFRPDRRGKLTCLDFVKSVDSVYKSVRLLRASIANSGQIDDAFERIFNIGFYLVIVCATLAALGLKPLALFFSISSLILAFAFMISSASSKYFEGILFVLLRRPYGIGDRIHVSSADNDTCTDGSPYWLVENVNLFSTTVRYDQTNEVATLANSSLSGSRVINAARSPKAIVHIYMHLPCRCDYEKVRILRSVIEDFAKYRPREWIGMTDFRATKVEQDQGFIEYCATLQHREAWQNHGAVLNSKSELSSFALEVAKKLELRYKSPPLPVNLRFAKGTPWDSGESFIPLPKSQTGSPVVKGLQSEIEEKFESDFPSDDEGEN